MAGPELSGVVVHWHAEEDLAALVEAWPDDPRFELVVVDNGASRPLWLPDRIRLVTPGRNLGFAAGVNRGVEAAAGAALLLLNPDVRPEPGALPALLAGLAAHPEAAGLVPQLTGAGGESQSRWQLRPLPRLRDLLGQAFFLDTPAGPATPPAAGTAIAQPAAAALCLRRTAFAALGGFDERYFPAWFEDVDFARRAAAAGRRFLYWPAARFTHGLGGSLEQLGYGRFLVAYTRNLRHYARRHHGRGGALFVGLTLPVALTARLLALPLRPARRAPSRAAAARGLLAALAANLAPAGGRKERR
ncbi:MAG: N-acetylglucosaminyl-diphospho-decaprenol L-rhamnosyltransferase [Acidobacteria bacterium ADurb.Bin051]|jgi:N-acetylglucosaminyl-diphospho-decaprenol L-rhamnosyltransferase|nr:MAG: N-acetylglucosaminyl-diphospho-decaprenol L-rhamnosyltransferase [Acidobacteria bacterium ADurb.Bin051]